MDREMELDLAEKEEGLVELLAAVAYYHDECERYVLGRSDDKEMLKRLRATIALAAMRLLHNQPELAGGK